MWWFLDVGDGAGGPLDIWAWFFQNITVQGTLNITGLVLLVVLFSRDLILTKGQHERRVADIKSGYDLRIEELNAAHKAELDGKDARYGDMLSEKVERYAEMKESRNYYRDGRRLERDTNRELVGQLVENNKGLAVAARALGALQEAAESMPEGP